jgi:hypothetical protein
MLPGRFSQPFGVHVTKLLQSLLVVAACLVLAGPALAKKGSDGSGKKDASPAQLAQQQKMKDCNAKAEADKPKDRKAFMSECLKKDAAPAKKEPSAAQKAQQQKMTDCNAKANTEKPKDRKAFMAACLKK